MRLRVILPYCNSDTNRVGFSDKERPWCSMHDVPWRPKRDPYKLSKSRGGLACNVSRQLNGFRALAKCVYVKPNFRSRLSMPRSCSALAGGNRRSFVAANGT